MGESPLFVAKKTISSGEVEPLQQREDDGDDTMNEKLRTMRKNLEVT